MGEGIRMGNIGSLGCRRPRHGASVEINTNGDTLSHLGEYGTVTRPLVESHKDGIRIGCTFVTTDALEMIYRYHHKFIKQDTSMVHQQGTQ